MMTQRHIVTQVEKMKNMKKFLKKKKEKDCLI